MNILYISSATSEDMIAKISEKYLNGEPVRKPQQTFDLSVAQGLAKQTNVSMLSIPPIPTYPSSNCIIYHGGIETLKKYNLKIKYFSLLNIFGFKQIGIFFYSLIKSYAWKKSNKKKNNTIILYAPYFPIMFASYIIKKITKIKVVLIVPDLPSEAIKYNNENFNIKNNMIKLLSNIKPKFEEKFDGYVFLTSYMDALINKKDKPYKVLEGLVRLEDIANDNELNKKKEKKVIMYAGAVYKKYGIEKLIEAFKKHVTIDCELWIYGDGDYIDELKEHVKLDERIKYKGVKFRKEILEEEKRVSLLINPRPTNENFTKYSFPSKILEYMASGTPIASTKLLGIPKEYESYIYWLDDESIEGMGKRINDIVAQDSKELHRFGTESQKWMTLNKNNTIQTKRIIDLLEEI